MKISLPSSAHGIRIAINFFTESHNKCLILNIIYAICVDFVIVATIPFSNRSSIGIGIIASD